MFSDNLYLNLMSKYDFSIGPFRLCIGYARPRFQKESLLVERSRIGWGRSYQRSTFIKTWWEIAREASAFRKGLHKYNIQVPPISFKEVQPRFGRLFQNRKSLLEEFKMEQLKKSNYAGLLEFKEGEAKLLTPNEVEITHGAKEKLFKPIFVILATGSRPRYLPELPIDERLWWPARALKTWIYSGAWWL